MPSAISDLQKHLREKLPIYYSINQQMRRDLERFAAAFKKIDTLDTATLKRVREYFGYHVTVMHAHWHNQEEHFFPTISRFFPAEQMRGSGEMIDDRRALRQLQDRLIAAWDGGNKEEMTKLMKMYADDMEQFAKKEEQFMAKTMLTVTKEQVDQIEKLIVDEQTPMELRNLLPWFLNGMDADLKQIMFAKIPKPAVWFWRMFMKRSFEKRLEVFEQISK